MKKIYRYFFAAVAIASAAACAEQLDDNQAPAGQIPAEFAQMTISASLGEVTKTTYKDQSVLWEGTESITVFSKGSEDTPTEFAMNWCSEDNTKASFTGLADLNAESYYAVYPHSATNACTDEGVLTVNIPAEQTAVAGGFASGANVAVAGFAKDDANVVFNNASTLLSFGFETDADAILTKSVTVKVKKNATEYYGIAGNVSVNYEADGDLVVSEGSVQSIVLNAPEGGFAKGETYYVAVAPVGAVAEMELLYTHTDGTTTCERKNSNIVASLTRSTLVPLETIPVAYDDLPQEDFEVTVDFTAGWPFPDDACVAGSEQTTSGEFYDYYYTPANSDVTYAMKFGLQRANKSETGKINYYSYVEDQGLKFGDKDGSGTTYGIINIPGIKGRYITSIKIVHTTSVSFTVADGTTFVYSASPNANTATTAGPTVIKFPYTNSGKTVPEYWEGAYNIRMRKADTVIEELVITYSKNNPAE